MYLYTVPFDTSKYKAVPAFDRSLSGYHGTLKIVKWNLLKLCTVLVVIIVKNYFLFVHSSFNVFSIITAFKTKAALDEGAPIDAFYVSNIDSFVAFPNI